MVRRRQPGRVVIDTMVVIRAARAFRQQPPEPRTAELQLVLAWRDNPEVFTWLFTIDCVVASIASCNIIGLASNSAPEDRFPELFVVPPEVKLN